MKLLRDVIKKRDRLEVNLPSPNLWNMCQECGWYYRIEMPFIMVRHTSYCSLYDPNCEVEDYG